MADTVTRLRRQLLDTAITAVFRSGSGGVPRLDLASASTMLRYALDVAIAVSVFSVMAVLALGGFDLGLVSATTAAKPLLHLLLLVPTRIAFGGDTWLTLRAAAVLATVKRIAIPWRIPPVLQDVAMAVAPTWSAAIVIGFVANILLFSDQTRPFHVHMPWPKLMETFVVFDSAWYYDIASRGYFFDTGAQSSIAFFPLYPLLMFVLAAPFGGSETALWIAGLATSLAAFVTALTLLHRLTESMSGSREVARRTILYVAIFPFSFYFSRVYTESLFLLCTVAAIHAGHQLRWARAGFFGALATATRPNGILIAVPLLAMAMTGGPSFRLLTRRVIPLAQIPLAMTLYCAYVYMLTGDALAWLEAQQHWGYSVGHLPHRHLLNAVASIESQGLYNSVLTSDTAPIDFVYACVAATFVAVVPFVVRTYGVPLGLYVLVSLAVPLSGNALVGIGRYLSVLFPAFMVIATLSSTRAHHVVIVVSGMLYTLFLVLFIGWYPLY